MMNGMVWREEFLGCANDSTYRRFKNIQEIIAKIQSSTTLITTVTSFEVKSCAPKDILKGPISLGVCNFEFGLLQPAISKRSRA